MITNTEIIIRLILAAIVGGLIGMERQVSNRPAGLRTHILVTVGSSLITLVSIDGFSNIGDPARVAAQIVTGIGFLGAGTIMKTEGNIKGLTTAASIWVSAGIGIAIGTGYYLGAFVTAGIALLTLINVASFEKVLYKKTFKTFELLCIGRTGLLGEIGTILGKHQIYIKDIRMIPLGVEEENELAFRITVKLPNKITLNELFKSLYEIDGVKTISFNDQEVVNLNYN